MFFKAVDNVLQIAHNGDAFADDAQLGCTSDLPSGHHDPTRLMSRSELIRGFRILAQSWERLLFTTGGAINLQKSFWTLIAWKWEKGVATMQRKAQVQGELQVTAGYSTKPVAVPRLDPQEGFRTLGVYISLNGSMKLSKQKLHETSMTYATAITGS